VIKGTALTCPYDITMLKKKRTKTKGDNTQMPRWHWAIPHRLPTTWAVGTRDGRSVVLMADHPLPTHSYPGSGNSALQLLQGVILRDTQNTLDTKLVPSFLQLPKPCIIQHSQGSAHRFSTPLSCLHRKQST